MSSFIEITEERSKVSSHLGDVLTSSDDDSSAESLLLPPPSTFIQQHGGGKRGGQKRKAEDIGGEDEYKRNLLEGMASFLSMVQHMGVSSSVVGLLQGDIQGIKQQVEADTPNLFTPLLGSISDKGLTTLLSIHTGAGKDKVKQMRAISRELFKRRYQQLADASYQVTTGANALIPTTELIMMSQFADEFGNISWKHYMQCITDEIKRRARTPPTTTSRGAGTEEAGTGDDDDDDDDDGNEGGGDDPMTGATASKSSRGRGRPKKGSTM